MIFHYVLKIFSNILWEIFNDTFRIDELALSDELQLKALTKAKSDW